ncbi:MAG: type II secretion system protein [Patescibacteria group bacterium]
MNRAFTLIELIISIAIFAAMTALVIAKYGSFNQGTIITNMAYDMALTIRTAQTYGLSVKSTTAGTDNFSSAYGVHFEYDTPTQFIFFADTNSSEHHDHIYDSDSGEAVTTYAVTQGALITSICLASQLSDCTDDGSGAIVLDSGDRLDITYKRPNPNASFYYRGESVPQPIAFITLTSSDGSNSQVVYVRKNGQISVNN